MTVMKLIFLGTGGGIPSVKRSLPSIAVKFSGHMILFDCGEGTQRQMMKAGTGFKREMIILLTHLHGDHILGLPGLIYTLSMLNRKDPLIVIGPPGTKKFIEAILSIRFGKLNYEIHVREILDGIAYESREYVIEAVRADHTVTALAYKLREKDRPGRMNAEYLERIGLPKGPLWGRLQRGEPVEFKGRIIRPEEVMGPPRPGRKIVYTGDTRPSDKIVEFSKDADVLIHDATFHSEFEEEALSEGHSTARGAAEIASKAGVKRLYLFHISPRYEGNEEKLLREARAVFPNSFLAEDLLSYEVPLSD
ncbi:MAG: ribonuclease Z [Thaumarchaeota archaeon]|nr:MAG: ribonuclease Z [Nitrososphaerota archaeon]RLI02403.1 MAG: ribonuclease Z [Candidatus Bathyarchaeota archaeon]